MKTYSAKRDDIQRVVRNDAAGQTRQASYPDRHLRGVADLTPAWIRAMVIGERGKIAVTGANLTRRCTIGILAILVD